MSHLPVLSTRQFDNVKWNVVVPCYKYIELFLNKNNINLEEGESTRIYNNIEYIVNSIFPNNTDNRELSNLDMNPMSRDVIYIEDLDSEVIVPIMDNIENYLSSYNIKVKDEDSDVIFDYLDNFINQLFPDRTYRNYN